MILHQTGGGRERHIGGEGGEQQQIDVGGSDAGGIDAAAGGFVAQIAGGLVGQGVPAFQDAGALDDPVGIEAELLMQMLVRDDAVRHIAARREDAHAGESAAARSRRRRTFFVHENQTDLG